MFLPGFLELLRNTGVARVVDETAMLLLLLLMMRLMLWMLLLVMRWRRLVLLLEGDLVDGVELNRLQVRRAPIATDDGKKKCRK